MDLLLYYINKFKDLMSCGLPHAVLASLIVLFATLFPFESLYCQIVVIVSLLCPLICCLDIA